MSNISTLNINGVDYSVGMNMAPCKLVGGCSNSGNYTERLILTTSDYDFINLLIVYNDSNASEKLYSIKIPKILNQNFRILYLSDIISASLSSETELNFSENIRKATVELYKYIN